MSNPDPEDYVRLLREGVTLLALDRANTGPALSRFEAAKRLAPAGDGTPWLNAGVVLDQLGRAPEAEANFLEGLVRDPDNHALRTNYAYVVGRRDAAAGTVAWRHIVARWPDDATAWTNLGTLPERAGRRADAIAAYDKALGLDEGLDAVRERLRALTVRGR